MHPVVAALGAKERARHAGKPDGIMHAVPPIHLRNAQAIAASKAKRVMGVL